MQKSPFSKGAIRTKIKTMQIFFRFIAAAHTLRDNFIADIGSAKPYALLLNAAGRLWNGLRGQLNGRPRGCENPDIAVLGREVLQRNALNFLRRNAPDGWDVCAHR